MSNHNILKNIKIAFFRWWPSTLTLLVVLYATLWPDPLGAEEMSLFPGADKVIHAIMMGGLTSAFLFDYRRSGRRFSRKVFIFVIGAMIVFSLLDEIAQKAMCLGRAFEWMDLIADTGGILLGAILSTPVINKIFKNRK